VDSEFVCRMEDVLDLYAEPEDPSEPVICFDETNKQLTKETRTPLPMEPGVPERFDYEYERNGTANLFLFFAPKTGWRHVEVTERRTKVDYTPKHGSWLNQAEIEFSLLSRQCLDRRIPDRETLSKEVAAWEMIRNTDKAKIKWLFRVENAREKLQRFYPSQLPG
jgi:hypothetical protein